MRYPILYTLFCWHLNYYFQWMVPYCCHVEAFTITITSAPVSFSAHLRLTSTRKTTSLASSPSVDVDNSNNKWQGEVVQGGKISGCTISQVEGSLTEWIITIDGIEADLGRFSDVVYKKIIKDAKNQRFQGFRPGTIPPHLETTYKAFAMDECARETVLEAMQQNNIRPFDSSRQEFKFLNFCIPPPPKKGGGGKKKRSNKPKKVGSAETPPTNNMVEESEKTSWLTFETMKQAIDAGWKPGQSFSFVAQNCKGQKVLDASQVKDARPIGLNY